VRLESTFTHPLGQLYSRRGGPWDVSPLPTLIERDSARGLEIVDGLARYGHRFVQSAILALAGGLSKRGVGRGDVVAWQLPNWNEVVLLYFACWHLGAIAVPLHHRLRMRDLAGTLKQIEPKCALAAPGLAMSEAPSTVVVRGPEEGFEELSSQPPLPGPTPSRSDIAVGMLTSGSTGEPKVVLHSHRGLAYKARMQQVVHDLDSRDVILMPAPLSHVTGLVNGVLLPAAAGMRVVLMDAWNPEQALELIENEHVTFIGGPAVFLASMTESTEFASTRVASLRVCSMGGSTMTPAALAQLAAKLGCTVKRTYGMTEAPTVATLHAGDPPEMGRETDGRAVGEAEIQIVEPTGLQRLEAGAVGEVWVRGPEMFVGYADAGQTADSVTEDGWLRTGDLGVLDLEGWLTIAGRIKELIIRGGENISSTEVEGHIESHPAVRQAVAVGYPDPIMGERVAAVVVADKAFTLDACRQWFNVREVAKFKIPEFILHLESIPMTPTEKPDRRALRILVAEQMDATKENV
jgi:acyl-CoA synthetase (AMP-forming)/AMP-acid ligase II